MSEHPTHPPSDSFPIEEESYRSLREVAGKLVKKFAGQRVEPTLLLHEAYLRMAERSKQSYRSRTHFFASSARVMRHILVDLARESSAAKRGGGLERVTLSNQCVDDALSEVDAIDLSSRLDELSELDPRAAKVIELRFFGGLTYSEVSDWLQVSERTVRGDWAMARAWLRRALELT